MNSLQPIAWRAGLGLSAIALQCRMGCFSDPPVLVLVDWVEFLSSRLREGCWAALSVVERERYGQFHMTADRERFLVGRGLLRQLLGVWLRRAPKEVVICLGQQGKPFCSGGPEFNLSHSGRFVLLGFHPCRPVGVDLEQLKTCSQWYPIAIRFWGQEVADEIAECCENERHGLFLRYWCNHEAACKAAGFGLAASRSPDLLRWDLQLWSVILPSGYCGSVAMLGGSPVADQPF